MRWMTGGAIVYYSYLSSLLPRALPIIFSASTPTATTVTPAASASASAAATASEPSATAATAAAAAAAAADAADDARVGALDVEAQVENGKQSLKAIHHIL